MVSPTRMTTLVGLEGGCGGGGVGGRGHFFFIFIFIYLLSFF